MKLADYYLGDARLVLVPIEHLSRTGMSEAFTNLVRERRGWSPERVAFFDTAFSLYWERTRMLSHSRACAPPRLRNVALVADPLEVRPYVQLLNTSSWTLYESDFDPEISHPEFAAYLLVHGDRMAESGEVTMAAIRDAAYWFERTDEECAAFAAAAAESPRADAAAFRALAKATGWLRKLRHETLRPAMLASAHRTIPGTGILVPRDLEQEPPKLVERWTKVAARALKSYHARWRTPDAGAVDELCTWLVNDAPPLLVVDRRRVIWDPERPDALGRVRAVLKQAGGRAVRAIGEDLSVIAGHTRRFLAALADPTALPAPAGELDSGGYAYLHDKRRLIAYDLREPEIERLQGPDLPYARAMLGARTIHEWAHLVAMAGWVPCTVSDERFAELKVAMADQLDVVVASGPIRVQRPAAADLEQLTRGQAPGAALTELFLARIPDYQANLVAWPFLAEAERETYVRHNVRTLRPLYGPHQLWRMLIRYLYEYQYLGLSSVEDARTYFLRSTWFDVDFIESNILDEAGFDALAAAAGALCTCHTIDETHLRLPT